MEVKKSPDKFSKAFYKLNGKNILVTGGAGFIGSHLVKALLIEKCNIIVLDIKVRPNSYFKSQKLGQKVKLIKCDVRNGKQMFDVVKKNKIDFIFHLAALPIIEKTYLNPREALETNIMGTVNICEAARIYGKVEGLVVTSSDKAYGKIPRAKESDPIGGNHPYEVSKSSADLIARAYYITYNLPVVVTRFGNVYGAGDINFSRIIPGIMESLICNKTLKIRSNGKFVRDYVYVEDIVNSLITIVINIDKIYGEAFNVSSFENLSVLQLIKKVNRFLGRNIKFKITNTALNEIPIQSIDFEKITKKLGWIPKSNLGEAIEQTFVWYKQYFGEYE